MSGPSIVVADQPNDADRKAIVDPLIAYNHKAGGDSHHQLLAILIKDPANGQTLGGLWGRTGYDWLFVELFVVPEQYRDQNLGSQILAQAEDIARKRGCIGAWLDTFAFQAPEFYKKQGYEVFGTIEDYPRGAHRAFLKKRF
jgi:GNAT superfamily N-acetyltransferase